MGYAYGRVDNYEEQKESMENFYEDCSRECEKQRIFFKSNMNMAKINVIYKAEK